jgi:hypothetical protein
MDGVQFSTKNNCAVIVRFCALAHRVNDSGEAICLIVGLLS